MYDSRNNVIGSIGTLADLTERKRAEEKLRKSEEQFSKAFHMSPAGLTITRIADGKIIDANESFLNLFEFSREEVIGHTSTELNILNTEERGKLIKRQLESEGLHNAELIAQSKSGKLISTLFSSKPIEVDGEACHITTLIDITERKQMEEELINRMDELDKFNKLMVGRENKMADLKEEINLLLNRLGEPKKYGSS